MSDLKRCVHCDEPIIRSESGVWLHLPSQPRERLARWCREPSLSGSRVAEVEDRSCDLTPLAKVLRMAYFQTSAGVRDWHNCHDSAAWERVARVAIEEARR